MQCRLTVCVTLQQAIASLKHPLPAQGACDGVGASKGGEFSAIASSVHAPPRVLIW